MRSRADEARELRAWIDDRARAAGGEIKATLADFERRTGATVKGLRVTHAHPMGQPAFLAIVDVEWKL